jgi:hypothetical protein
LETLPHRQVFFWVYSLKERATQSCPGPLYGKIKPVHHIINLAFTIKNRLMTHTKLSSASSAEAKAKAETKIILYRLIILGFMVLVGFSMAKSIQSKSMVGLLLALTSLGAGIYFLYLVASSKEEMEREQNI